MAKSKELSKLTPKAIEIDLGDDNKVLVPGDKEENDIMMKIMAAKIRDLVEQTIKQYKDTGARLSPKDLKDLASAGKDIAEFSGNVYKEEAPRPTEEKKAEQVIDVEDFGALNKKKKEEENATG